MPIALSNWAGNLAYRADVLHEPRSLDELRDVVTRTPHLRALGSRHCFNDVADGAALVSLDRMPGTIEVDAATATARVPAATRYGTLAARLHELGWGLHTMASLPHISVAGAVATSTHGSGDRNPSLAAVVVGLELVTARGEVLELTEDDADLQGAVVGLGALGVVTTLTIRVEPTYQVAQTVETGLPWAAALDDLDEVMGSADSVSLFTDWLGPDVAQVWRKQRTGSDRLTHRSLGARPATGQMHPIAEADPRSATAQLGEPGPWHERLPHFRMEFTPSRGEELQTEYLVPRAAGAEAIAAVRRLGDRIAPLLLVTEIRSVAADPGWLSTTHERDSIAIHFTWQRRQPEVETLLPRVEEALMPFAPRPHWGKLFTAAVAGSPEALRAVYPRFDDFRSLAARLDPDGRFHNDFLRRHGLTD